MSNTSLAILIIVIFNAIVLITTLVLIAFIFDQLFEHVSSSLTSIEDGVNELNKVSVQQNTANILIVETLDNNKNVFELNFSAFNNVKLGEYLVEMIFDVSDLTGDGQLTLLFPNNDKTLPVNINDNNSYKIRFSIVVDDQNQNNFLKTCQFTNSVPDSTINFRADNFRFELFRRLIDL